MFDHSGKQIYLICGPTDMRKGTDGLSAIVNLFFASLKSPLLQNKFPRHRVGIFIPQIS